EFVPSAQARQGLLPCYIANPAAGACTDPAAYVQVPNLQRGMLPYAQLFWPEPAPNTEVLANGLPTGVARSIGNPVRRTQEDFGLARFDYNVSSADSLMTNFTADQGQELDPENNTNFVGTDTRNLYTLSVQETHIFSPTILNVATFGHTRARATSAAVAAPGVSIPENLVFLRDEKRKSPGAFSIGGTAATNQASTIIAPNPQNPLDNSRQYYSGSNDLSITRGRHTLKLGVWFQRVQQTGFSSGQNNAGTVVYRDLLGFLQDQPTQFVFASDPTELNFRTTTAAWYFQDEIKLRPNLTLRLGLRDEMTTGWNERDGHASNYSYDQNGVILTHPYIGKSALLENNAVALWQPRVGVAWDPTELNFRTTTAAWYFQDEIKLRPNL
ncbi:MAG: TonB-dependent receptor domain-containing protein, partial [Gammaproteobacteria bacterium]